MPKQVTDEQYKTNGYKVYPHNKHNQLVKARKKLKNN
jgi:hypothetical protein